MEKLPNPGQIFILPNQKDHLKMNSEMETSMSQAKARRGKGLRERKHVCAICEKGFTFKSDLDRHSLSHSGERPHQCPTCSKKFQRKDYLMEHLKTHSSVKPFACPTCAKQFRRKVDLKLHERCHSGEKPHECPTCLRGFSQKGHLNEHLRIHSAEKPFVCPSCSQQFRQKSALNSHSKSNQCLTKLCTPKESAKKVINDGLEQNKSDFCFEVPLIKEESNPGDGLFDGAHLSVKLFACPICSKRFKQKSDLKVHLRIHSGQKPFECQTCHKRFTQKGHLNEHLRIHTAEKPFLCPICSQQFRHKSALNKHMMSHPGQVSNEGPTKLNTPKKKVKKPNKSDFSFEVVLIKESNPGDELAEQPTASSS